MIDLMQRKTYAEGARIGAAVHNRFDIEVQNIETGEVRKFQALNMVLDQMWTRLCGRSTYFVNIHFGTGTGTLAASRTSLFTHLGTKAVTNDAQSKALPTSYWRQKIVLAPEEYVGSTLTEVGVAYGSTSTNLVTHALLRDMNGNVTALLKTALDVVTIYATVYVTFSTSNANLKLVGMPSNNMLVNYLIGGASFGTHYFYTGAAPTDLEEENPTLIDGVGLGKSAALSWTSDIANKKCHTNTLRFAIGESNGHIKEIGVGNSLTNPILRLLLPASGIYSGLAISGASIGTGTGALTKFMMPSKNIDWSTLVLKLDESPTTAYSIALVNVSNHNFSYVNPAILPQDYSGKGVLSGDGNFFACSTYSYSTLYLARKINGLFTKTTNPTGLPAGYPTCQALDGDGSVLAVGHSGSPYITTYEWNGSAYIKRSDPDILPTGAAVGCSLSSNGLILAVLHNNSPFISTYDWTGGSWVKRTNPSNLPAGSGRLAMNSDGSIITVWYSSTVYTYDWTGGSWVKRTNLTGTAGTVYDMEISGNGNRLALGHYDGNKISVYEWSGSSWVKLTDPSSLPGSNVNGVGLNGDGTVLLCATYLSPRICAYDWIDGAWVRRTDLSPAPIGECYSARISRDDTTMAVCFGGSPYMYIYDNSKLQTEITFDTPPADGAVITADYTVNGIHKTAQRVIDLYAEIVFGEPV